MIKIRIECQQSPNDKVDNDFIGYGVKVVNAETGEEVRLVQSVRLDMSMDSFPVATIVIGGVDVLVDNIPIIPGLHRVTNDKGEVVESLFGADSIFEQACHVLGKNPFNG